MPTTPPTRSRATQPDVVGLGDDRDAEVGGEPDDDDVENRPDPGHLLERDPEQEDDSAGDDDDLTESERHLLGQALVEHVPRVQAEGRLDHHRHREAVQEQAGATRRTRRSGMRFIVKAQLRDPRPHLFWMAARRRERVP